LAQELHAQVHRATPELRSMPRPDDVIDEEQPREEEEDEDSDSSSPDFTAAEEGPLLTERLNLVINRVRATRRPDPLGSAFSRIWPPGQPPAAGARPVSRAAEKPGGGASKGFAAARLGIPAASASSTGSGAEETRGQGQEDQKSVRYLHIPKHAMKDFRTFAQNVANEAVTVSNPYVRALCNHRAQLQTSLLEDSPEDQTLQQRMATNPESLTMLSTVGEDTAQFLMESPVAARVPQSNSIFQMPLASCYSCGSVLGGGVATVSADAAEVATQETLVGTFAVLSRQQAETAAESPTQGSPLGARSSRSTTCSSPSVGDEADPGPPESLWSIGARRSNPTLLSGRRSLLLGTTCKP